MGHPTGGNGFGIGEVFQREPIFARGARYHGTCMEAMETIVSDDAMDVHVADRFLLLVEGLLAKRENMLST